MLEAGERRGRAAGRLLGLRGRRFFGRERGFAGSEGTMRRLLPAGQEVGAGGAGVAGRLRGVCVCVRGGLGALLRRKKAVSQARGAGVRVDSLLGLFGKALPPASATGGVYRPSGTVLG